VSGDPSPSGGGVRGGRVAGVVLIAVSAAAFGAMPILARTAYAAGADPVAVLTVRFWLAAAVMAALMGVTRRRWPRGRVLLLLIGMGGIGYVGQSLSYFTALTMASAGLVALLLYLYPVLVTVLAVLVLRERVTPVKVVALGLALAGSALTVVPALDGGQVGGIVLGLAAASIYAVYILVGSRVTPQAGAIGSSAVVMGAAAVVYALLAVAVRPALPETAAGWAAVVAIALLCTVVAIVAFFAGLARVGPADAATLSTLEPVVSLALAGLVLGEVLAPVQLAGGVLILAGVVTLARVAQPPAVRQVAPAEPPASRG
jgi:drug/metabolite transporter (DMT)-like permease